MRGVLVIRSVVRSVVVAASAVALTAGPSAQARTVSPDRPTVKERSAVPAAPTSPTASTSPTRTAVTKRSVAVAPFGAGTVTGTVRGPDGTPAPGVVVTVTSPAAPAGRTYSATSGADGGYAIRGVPAPGLAGEWCADASAQPRPLASRCDTTGLRSFDAARSLRHDVWLRTGRVLTGTVEDESGVSLPGAVLWLRPDGIGPPVAARATAGPDGTFSVRSPHGTRVEVCAAAPDLTSATAPYGHSTTCLPGIHPGADALRLSLPPAAGVAGRVTAKGGAPLAGVRVAPTTTDSSFLLQTWTAADGTYLLRGLAPWQDVLGIDSGRVAGAHGTGFVWQPHTDPATGQQRALELTPGRLLEGVRDVLEPGAAVRGRITGPSGSGVQGVAVNANRQRYVSDPVRTAITDRSGEYLVVGVRTGLGGVCADPRPLQPSRPNLLRACWNEQPPNVGAGVDYRAGVVSTGIDVKVGAAVAAIVTAKDASGAPQGGLVVTTVNDQQVTGQTDPSGTALLRNLVPGEIGFTYKEESAPAELAPTGLLSGDLVRVTPAPGAVVPVSLVVRPAAAVTGRVTDAAGVPLDLVDVGPLTGTVLTDQTGRFTLRGLDAGASPTTGVCFWAWRVRGPSPTGYLPRCHGEVSDPYSAQQVPLTNGRTVTLPDVVLTEAGAVSGTVRRPDGSPAPSVGVTVSTREGRTQGGWLSAAEDGTYRVVGVEPGEYVVCFSPGDAWRAECWDDAADLASGTAITVVAGRQRTRVDAVLDPRTP